MAWRRSVLIAATLVASWLGMQAVHELGHVLGALFSGGHVNRVVLHPLAISRTDVEPNPQPVLVVWLGPLLGVVIPMLVWMTTAALQLRGAYVLRFFAGFCLIANGLYIGMGSLERIGDAGVMLAHGAPIWTLWLFGLLTAPLGFWLWHGQGRYFGLGPQAEAVDMFVTWCVVASALGLALLGIWLP